MSARRYETSAAMLPESARALMRASLKRSASYPTPGDGFAYTYTVSEPPANYQGPMPYVISCTRRRARGSLVPVDTWQVRPARGHTAFEAAGGAA